MTYYASPPSAEFRVVASGTEPGAAFVTCDGAWLTSHAVGNNLLKCSDTDVNVHVAILGSGGVDVHVAVQ